tara:strand:- start:751 stop:945 length:195 start_codon:yes stop_codon:yes gene_type:complete
MFNWRDQFRLRYYQVVTSEFAIKAPIKCQKYGQYMVMKKPFNLGWGELPKATFRVSFLELNPTH